MGEYRELIIVILGGIVLPLAAGGYVGGLLVRWGLRRRIGTTRRCRRCDYALTGIDSTRCPECGAELGAANVAIGDRRPNPWLVLAGVLFMAVSVGPVVFLARADWYQFRPSLWVVDDLSSPNTATANRAWELLGARREAGTLSDAVERKTVNAILAEHASPKPGRLSRVMYQLFCEKYRDGKLTQAEQNRFFSQVMRTKLDARRVVAAGGDVPFRVHGERRMMSDPGWWIRQSFSDRGRSYMMSGGQPDGTPTGVSSTLRGGASTTPGTQQITIVERVEIFHGERYKEDESRLCWSGETPHHFALKVVEADSPEFFRMIDDPAMPEPLRQSITISDLKLQNGYVSGTVRAIGVPVAIAFDIVVRVGTFEKRVGSIVAAKGRSAGTTFGPFPFQTDAKLVDILLRSNRDVGTSTIDVFEAWDGAILFPGEIPAP